MTGFTRPKRYSVPTNKHFTAIRTEELDKLEAACEQFYAENAELREKLDALSKNGLALRADGTVVLNVGRSAQSF